MALSPIWNNVYSAYIKDDILVAKLKNKVISADNPNLSPFNSLHSAVALFQLLALTCLLWSCNSLKPIVHNDLEQVLTPNDLSRFNGEYDILSSDSSYPHLIHALTFCENKQLDHFIHLEYFGKKELKVKLKATDNTHLKVRVYSHNKVIRTRTIKGEISENYFHFTRSRLTPVFPLYLVLTLAKKQKNRIGLLKNGDLTLDYYEGAVLLFTVMPTFGGDDDKYNLIFKRRK